MFPVCWECCFGYRHDKEDHLKIVFGSSRRGSVVNGIQIGTMRLQIRSLASLSGLRIWHCHELWCWSQTWLGSGIAVAWHRPLAIAPITPLAWEPPYAAGATLEKEKRQKKKIVFVCSTCVHMCLFSLNWHFSWVSTKWSFRNCGYRVPIMAQQ